MRLTRLSALALAVEAAYGYLDTSPFFMFSTSELLIPTSQLETAASITADVSLALSQCPSQLYYIVSQPGVQASDYSVRKTMPTLFEQMNQNRLIRSRISVSDVLGDIDTQVWQELLQSKCGAQVSDKPFSKDSLHPRIVKLELAPPSVADPGIRAADLLDNDDKLLSMLIVPSLQNYTVLYTTSPGLKSRQKMEEYEMADGRIAMEQDPMHADLKRDLTLRAPQIVGNQTVVDGALFEKYQFLSPGIFMGLVVGFLLLSILYVAISGVASLQVTYAAFEKESGPSSGKKAQ